MTPFYIPQSAPLTAPFRQGGLRAVNDRPYIVEVALGLTRGKFCGILPLLKALTKTCAFGKFLREGLIWCESPEYAACDTTSESPGRNARMGAPITAPMSDGNLP